MTKKNIALAADDGSEATSATFSPYVYVSKATKNANTPRKIRFNCNIDGAFGGVNKRQLRHILAGVEDIDADSGLGQLVAAMNEAQRLANDPATRAKLFKSAGCDEDGLPAKKAKSKSTAAVALDDEDDDEDE